MSGHGRRGRGDGPRPRLAAGRRWQERRRRRRRACGAGGHGTSQARRPAPSAGMGSAARAGAARALEEARRAAKETVFLWAAFWRSSRQRGKRCPSLVARHGAIRRPGGVSSRSCARAPSDRAGKMPNIIRDLRSGPVS
ncbi:unnamed protein product [Prorocentrum cordatum]|uniref:Uncharacterized protein n=1 Tax=Prorocentrum cordatum TaxID=2364126 RepID=A0ABN9QXV1_9DINO|nr:unnamed protein product [Polarella glacialis]